MALDSRKKIRHVHSCGCVLFGFHFPRGYLCEVVAWGTCLRMMGDRAYGLVLEHLFVVMKLTI